MFTFIGVGSAFNTEYGNTSAWMKRDSRLLIVDCGGSVFERILKRELFKGITSIEVCLTHTHGDHVGSLGDLILYGYYILKIKPTIHHPDSERIKTLLMIFGVPEEAYTLADEVTFSLEDWLEGRFVRSEHVDTMTAYGIVFRLPQISSWYSGDSREIPAEILEEFLQGGIDLLYQDTSGMEYPGSFHMSLTRLTDRIPESFRNKVICMHQDEAFSREKAEELGFRVAVVGK